MFNPVKRLLNKHRPPDGLVQMLTVTEFYERTMVCLSQMEGLLLDAAFEMTGDIIFKSLGAGALIKASGMEFADDYSFLCEKIVDYMELVSEYDRRKLFIYINMRSYVSDREAEEFMDTVLRHGYEVLMIENREYPVISYEKRFIVDQGLCEIK